jgi:hypothetical protein
VDDLSENLAIPAKLDDLKAADFDQIASDALKEARASYAVPKVMKPADVAKVLTSVASGNRDVSFG